MAKAKVKQRLRVITDCDGVLTDVYSYIAGCVRRQFEYADDFAFTEEYVDDWGMLKLKERWPDVHKYILNEIFRSEAFIDNPPLYAGVLEAGKALCRSGVYLEIHTATYEDRRLRGTRFCRMKLLLGDMGFSDRRSDVVMTRQGATKAMRGDVVIEDNVENLLAAEAPVKYLVAQAHNLRWRESQGKEGIEQLGIVVVNSFAEAAKAIINDIKKVGV